MSTAADRPPSGASRHARVFLPAAMMLPTTLPLFNVFDRLTSGCPDHGRLLVLLGLGYMAV